MAALMANTNRKNMDKLRRTSPQSRNIHDNLEFELTLSQTICFRPHGSCRHIITLPLNAGFTFNHLQGYKSWCSTARVSKGAPLQEPKQPFVVIKETKYNVG